MTKYLKYFYKIITSLFVLLTIYELYTYIKTDSNFIGLFYLLFNLYILFILFTIYYNYNKSKKEIRISKNIMVIILGLISSFILGPILINIFNYTDASKIYINKIFIISKIIKPIIYVLLGIITYFEIKLIKKSKI